MGYRLTRWLVSLIFRLVWRPHVSGVANIPRQGPVILASNHLSFIDSVVIPLAVPRQVRFLAKAEYFEGRGVRGRLSSAFFRLIDAVPVRRDGRRESMAALDAALGVLRDGGAFGIYPEGTRSRDGRLYRGRAGVGWLALASGASIVPVALEGTDTVQPVGRRLPRVRPLRVSFGEPLDPTPWITAVAAGGGAGLARREITDAVMGRIAAMSRQPLAAGYNDPPGGEDEPDVG